MSSIFPDTSAGGLIVIDHDTGMPVAQPDVENSNFAAGFTASCDVTALPSNCNARVEPAQINAIVAELVNLYYSMAPAREWDCNEQDNIAEAFEQFIQTLVGGGGGGGISCALVADGQAGEEAGAYLLYCNGETIQKWSVHGDGGLVEFVLDTFCGVDEVDLGNDDYVLFCREGAIKKTNALNFQLYLGEWLQARSYITNNLVRRNGRLYSPNAAIPAGTPFVIGTGGATWYEVSPGTHPPYDSTVAWAENTIVTRQGVHYAANSAIAANVPFVVGTAANTWRRVEISQAFIWDYAERAYSEGSVIARNGILYRSLQDLAPGPWDETKWEAIGGERSRYRGPWATQNAYVAEDMVKVNGRLYTANSDIPAATPFMIGTAANQWTEVSPSLGIAYSATDTYTAGQIVSWNGGLYIANGNIPVGIDPSNIGISGASWRVFGVDTVIRPFTNVKNYVAGEVMLKATNAYPNENAIWRSPNGQLAGDWDQKVFETIGERNKMRGRWNIADKYLKGDLVIRYGIETPYGVMFEANSDIPPNTQWAVGFADGQWTELDVAPTGGINLKLYIEGQTYSAGDYVLTRWGIYRAEADILATDDFADAAGKFSPYNSARAPIILDQAAHSAIRNHRNQTIGFSYAGPKTYVLGAGILNPGDTISGYSYNGQLTFAEAAGVTIRSPEGLSLRDRDYSSFLIKCLSVSGNGTGAEYLLAGDLEPIP